MRTIQLYDNGVPGNNMASVQSPTDGKIIGVQYAFTSDLDGDGEGFIIALEDVPTIQARTNEAQGTIAVWGAEMSVTTSGVAVVAINGYYPLPPFPVLAGQKLYLNGSGDSVVTSCLLIYIA